MMTFQGGGSDHDVDCGTACGLPTVGSLGERIGGDAGTHDAHNGLTSPSEARSDGASDHNFKSAPARSNWSTTASVGGDHQLTKSCRSCRCEVGGQPLRGGPSTVYR